MSDRPTREQVDRILAQADRGYMLTPGYLKLAREIRALREDLALARVGEQDAIDRCIWIREERERQAATIARVESLVDVLRSLAKTHYGNDTEIRPRYDERTMADAYAYSADRLEAVLRGDP